jgi:hypothetical protein
MAWRVAPDSWLGLRTGFIVRIFNLEYQFRLLHIIFAGYVSQRPVRSIKVSWRSVQSSPWLNSVFQWRGVSNKAKLIPAYAGAQEGTELSTCLRGRCISHFNSRPNFGLNPAVRQITWAQLACFGVVGHVCAGMGNENGQGNLRLHLGLCFS